MSEIPKTDRLVNNSGAYLGRVVIAKTSLDGHWRGVSVVARALRDSGFEVILLGMVKDGEISRAAIDEDADLIPLMTPEDEEEINNEDIPDILPILPLQEIECEAT